VEVEVWTHARSGLSENDFILAAKIDDLDISDLLSKKQPQPASSN
jgi:4a-hydroxytetrahydrobiopterin dehydratase